MYHPLLLLLLSLLPLLAVSLSVLGQQHLPRHFKNEGSRPAVQTVEDVTSLAGVGAFKMPLPHEQGENDVLAEKRRLLERQRLQLERQYPRDMRGYGENTPDPKWPGNAKVAVQFVVNYEEGGENNILHGDAASEAFLSEIVGAQALMGVRHYNMESIYEYGSRAGFWRLLRIFKRYNMKFTCYAVATALEKNMDVVHALQREGMEIASHGLKWVDYQYVSEREEWRQMKEAIRIHTEVTGERPLGWYLGRTSPNSVRLAMEEGGFRYIADSYADDLPYWIKPHIVDPRNVSGFSPDHKQLIVPYTLDVNDMRFATSQGFNSGEQFFQYMKDTFDTLYQEGVEGSPKMMSVGLHCRLVGRPGRAAALERFLQYIRKFPDVWVPTRLEIAQHWHTHHMVKTEESAVAPLEDGGESTHFHHHSPVVEKTIGEDEDLVPGSKVHPPRSGNDMVYSTKPVPLESIPDTEDTPIVNSLSDFAEPAP